MFNYMSRIPSKVSGFTIFHYIFKKSFTSTTKEKLDIVRKYNTKELIEFLRGIKELNLAQEEFDIIEKEKFTGDVFFEVTQENL